MPYDLQYAPVPLPPHRPTSFGYGQEDMNALAQLIQGPTREEKMQALMAQFRASPYGQPHPETAYRDYNLNMMRRDIYPYLQMLGLAVGDYRP